MSIQERHSSNLSVAIVGAGPAGLMAAETIAQAGYKVHVYDAMPSAARKFLLAGIGGMNITHAEAWPLFISRYESDSEKLLTYLEAFTPNDLRQWIHQLGIETFVGSSGRVFPKEMKAAPLLRAWLHRLRQLGVEFHMRHKCLSCNTELTLDFDTPNGKLTIKHSTVVLAMGGGSWPQLGSDGQWQQWLNDRGISSKPLLPSNCGFNIDWSDYLKQHHAGKPIKNALFTFIDSQGRTWSKHGECVLSDYGIEGSAIYALSAPLRDALISSNKNVTLHIDLSPERSLEQITAMLNENRKGASLSTLLKKKLKFTATQIALLHECSNSDILQNPNSLAKTIKQLPITLRSTRRMEEAISSAGGIRFESLTDKLMLKDLPGVFCAGEMLDWEAPTGGYLLTACFATGKAAGDGAAIYCRDNAK
jgi:hypothetical protein